jgi:N-acetylglucosamine-6-phosphate deacetylase
VIAIAAPRLFDGLALSRDRVVVIDDGRIAGVSGAAAGVVPEALPPDAILAPGFIDLQVNGGGGLLLNNAISSGAMRDIAAAHARAGTTSILPTLISGGRTDMAAALSASAQPAAGVAGLHIEGPFIAPARHGIHPVAAIRPMHDDDLALLTARRCFPLLVTVAPDAMPTDHIAALVRAGVVVFAGHTDATFEQAAEGVRAGISGFTHLYNAMSPLTSRAPGAVGAALALADTHAGIIVDGHHVHPAAVRAAFAAKGAARLFLVSDAMATAASDVAEFALYSKRIVLRDCRLTDDAGTLAGAHLTMAEAVRNAVQLAGIPLADALRMASATPAACMGLHDRGKIAAGGRADLVALDAGLRVIAVWQDGVRLPN